MDGRQTGKSDTEFGSCMYYYIDLKYACGIYGCICNRKNALEIFRGSNGLFYDGNDDSGSLRVDPAVYQIFKMGMTNSLVGLILPYLTFALPVTVFIMTGFFKSMPNELIESACIDGCSIYQIFYKIALPLSRTGLFVTGLMTFVANWNELLLAMVFISDDTKKTLPVSLSKFVGPYNTNYSQMFAAIVLAIVPTIVVYCCFSNQIVDGLTTGAVKG